MGLALTTGNRQPQSSDRWRYGKWLPRLTKIDSLILDDWGMGAIDSMTLDLLEIIGDRGANKATIIPTNCWSNTGVLGLVMSPALTPF